MSRTSTRPRLRRAARPALRVVRQWVFTVLSSPRWQRSARFTGRGPTSPSGRPLVTILLINAFAAGGTVRTVFTWCGRLTERFDVEVVSVYQEVDEPFFPLPAGVRLSTLDDRRRPEPGAQRGSRLRWLLSRLPSVLWSESDGAHRWVSLWTDVQLVRRLRDQRSGAVVATRTALNILVAELARPTVRTMGQQHTEVSSHHNLLQKALRPAYRKLDVLAVLTEQDEQEFSVLLAGSATRLARIPNALPPLSGPLADGTQRLVVSIGGLRPYKGHDLLIEAFAAVADRHPDWRLIIYGEGPERAALEQLITARGLTGVISLPGLTSAVGERLAEASIYALSSRHENFGIALVEAMSKGLAVVSFDCPRGPAEIVTHGVDGLLVPPQDVQALGAAINRMIQDDDLRRRCAAQAVRSAQRFDLDAISDQWLQLFTELLHQPAPSSHKPDRPAA